MISSTTSLAWTNDYGNQFQATICNSFPLRLPECDTEPTKVTDVVATKEGGCDIYGRSDNLERIDFLNFMKPDEGLLLTYGNGQVCQRDVRARVTFQIKCDQSITNPNKMLVSVSDNTATSCEHIYHFASRAGCPSQVPGATVTPPPTPEWVWLLLASILILALYCAISIYRNFKLRGATGFETIPHFETITRASMAVARVIRRVAVRVRCAVTGEPLPMPTHEASGSATTLYSLLGGGTQDSDQVTIDLAPISPDRERV
jgi:hypothetical protein